MDILRDSNRFERTRVSDKLKRKGSTGSGSNVVKLYFRLKFTKSTGSVCFKPGINCLSVLPIGLQCLGNLSKN